MKLEDIELSKASTPEYAHNVEWTPPEPNSLAVPEGQRAS